MAKFIPDNDPDVKKEDAIIIYKAAEEWRNNCLLKDGSMFFPGEKLWTKENFINGMQKHWIDNITAGEGDFWGKLEIQLQKAPDELRKLMAETIWFLQLVNSKRKTKDTLENIQRYVSPKFEIKSPYKDISHGIGSAGQNYSIFFWRELFALILFMQKWKSLSAGEQSDLSKDGWGLSEQYERWAKEFNEKYIKYKDFNNRTFRHILLHLIFPDQFERVLSGGSRSKIIKYFNKDIDAKTLKGMSWTEKDKVMLKTRQEQEEKYGKAIDFYREPCDKWRSADKEKTRGVAEPRENANAEKHRPVRIIPLNRIFYGPPGTGKTYHTINAALEILDPKFYNNNKENREELRKRFEEIRGKYQIGFVTFHQSFSYEEFVEGIRPDLDGGSGEKISYKIKDGIFKELCGRAQSKKPLAPFESALNDLKEKCLGQAKAIRMRTDARGSKINVWYEGGKTFRVKPADSKSNQESYPTKIEHIRKAYQGENSDRFYNISYVRAIIKYMKENYSLDEILPKNDVPYVLIIDEINRGNISKIFGELITLIEDSRRLGNAEATTVTLPYSGEPFSVPNNLYIIGTMNTADRSIALLDTALRRRFRFEEMMPDYAPLANVAVEDINIARMLEAINQRIEAIYDRDHQIGHSYFLSLKKDEPTLAALADIFHYQILPLLQEYFYEDWEKIDIVLHNNGFLEAKSAKATITSELVDSEKRIWWVNEDALKDADKYLKIYANKESEPAPNDIDE